MTRLKILLVILILSATSLAAYGYEKSETITEAVIETGYGTEVIQLIETKGIGEFALNTSYNINGTIKYDIQLQETASEVLEVIYNPYNPKKSKLMVKNVDTGDKY